VTLPTYDTKQLRAIRSSAWGAMLVKLRAEHLDEHRRLLRRFSDHRNPSVRALGELRRLHPDRAAVLYALELVARGLPAPSPRRGGAE
jgi:hypothetical protein